MLSLKQSTYIVKKTKTSYLRILFATITAFYLFSSYTQAQDTTWVQTYTFDSLWTRRARFYFPTANQKYRKILMYYKLKCYASVSGDGKYPCGEWDGPAHHFVYDHRGKLDSTYKSISLFKVNGDALDSLRYTPIALYDLNSYYKYNKVVDAISTANSYTLGTNTIAQQHPFDLVNGKERSQFIWKSSELTAAGMTAGNVTGLKLFFQNNNANLRNVRIRMRHILNDSFDVRAMTVDSLEEVYYYDKLVTISGWNSFVFKTPFNWNGISNILIDFSFDNNTISAANYLVGSNTASPMGAFSIQNTICVGAYDGKGGAINCGRSLNMFTGAAPRTYEFWGNINSFNDASIIYSGSGGNNNWFIIRAKSNNRMSVDLYNLDVIPGNNISANVWKHYALTFKSGTFTLYENGKLKGTDSKPINTGNADDFQIGGGYGNFIGSLSNLRIWDTDLSQQEIADWFYKDVSPSHPKYSNLKADYRLNINTAGIAYDSSSYNQNSGDFYDKFWWKNVAPKDYYFKTQLLNWRPQIQFERNTFTSHIDSVLVTDTMYRPPLFVDFYANTGANKIIDDNSATNPSLRTSRRLVWNDKWRYKYLNGVKIDSTLNRLDSLWINQKVNWYSNTVAYEIGRAITPYGINLNMGDGKTWLYDMTDYYPILQDTVDLAVGSNYEVQDVRFAFIKGDPPAEVIGIQQPWGKGLYEYKFKDLAANTIITPISLTLVNNTSIARLKTRLTGHGASGNGSSSNGCCEFMDNEHYVYANGHKAHTWHIFRGKCTVNPLYPQGGTWVYPREGWCPGDITQGNDFDVSSGITGSTLNIDYGINPVPSGNPALGDGVYSMSMQLVQYKSPTYLNDAEVYDILRPTNDFRYSRTNPFCHYPQIIIRNNGANRLKQAVIKYKVSGGTEETYNWSGDLGFLDTATVTLPINPWVFWNGDNTKQFIARISGVNNGMDDYVVNDTIRSYYTIPDNYLVDAVVIKLTTNKNASDNTLKVFDANGNVVVSRTNLSPNTTYTDTVRGFGCYNMQLSDNGGDGLSFWAHSSQGSGSINILRTSSPIPIKRFEPDFGGLLDYSFSLGFPLNSPATQPNNSIVVYPNPAADNYSVGINGYSGSATIELINTVGQIMSRDIVNCDSYYFSKSYSSVEIPNGVYHVRISFGNIQEVKKLVINK